MCFAAPVWPARARLKNQIPSSSGPGTAMTWKTLFGCALATISMTSAGLLAQDRNYPVTVIPPGKGPYTFPVGYQTPWEKIEMQVTEKLAPNLYLLHGSSGLDPAHP